MTAFQSPQPGEDPGQEEDSPLILPTRQSCDWHLMEQHMLEFVGDREVRYDEYSNQHLHGQEYGYYKVFADISNHDGGDCPTPSGNDPVYREQLAGLLMSGFSAMLQHREPDLNSPPLIVEVGGGGGALKKQVCSILDHFEIEVNFTSVEPNPQHRDAQILDGTAVVEGRAEKLPFGNNEVDFLFDEEVLDCFPFRIWKWDQQASRVTEELFVRRNGDKLETFWKPVDESDIRIQHSEVDLKDYGYKQQYYRYAGGYWDYLQESARVLRPGGMRISTDYGFIGSVDSFLTIADLGHEERAVKRPYTVDLTHFVDFGLLHKLARVQSKFSNFDVLSLQEAFGADDHQTMARCMGRFAFFAVCR